MGRGLRAAGQPGCPGRRPVFASPPAAPVRGRSGRAGRRARPARRRSPGPGQQGGRGRTVPLAAVGGPGSRVCPGADPAGRSGRGRARGPAWGPARRGPRAPRRAWLLAGPRAGVRSRRRAHPAGRPGSGGQPAGRSRAPRPDRRRLGGLLGGRGPLRRRPGGPRPGPARARAGRWQRGRSRVWWRPGVRGRQLRRPVLGRRLAPGADRPGRPAGRRAGRGDAAGVPRGGARWPAARAVAGRGAGCLGRRGRAGPAGPRGPAPAAARAPPGPRPGRRALGGRAGRPRCRGRGGHRGG